MAILDKLDLEAATSAEAREKFSKSSRSLLLWSFISIVIVIFDIRLSGLGGSNSCIGIASLFGVCISGLAHTDAVLILLIYILYRIVQFQVLSREVLSHNAFTHEHVQTTFDKVASIQNNNITGREQNIANPHSEISVNAANLDMETEAQSIAQPRVKYLETYLPTGAGVIAIILLAFAYFQNRPSPHAILSACPFPF